MLRPLLAVGLILTMLIAACAAPTPTPTATPAPTLAPVSTLALPIPAPVGLTVHDAGIKTAAVSWREVAGTNAYEYRVRRPTSSWASHWTTQETRTTVDGLRCGVNYQVKVRGLTAAGGGEWSEPVQFNTLPCPNATPTRTPTPVPTATPTPTPIPGTTRNNSVPFGSSGRVISQSDWGNYGKWFQVSVVEVVRGSDAFERILDGLRQYYGFSDARILEIHSELYPESGQELMLFKVRILYEDGQEGVADDFEEEVNVISSSGFAYGEEIAAPEPNLRDAALWPGATQELWVAWQVATDDSAPLLLFGASRDYEGGGWFSMQVPSTALSTPSISSIVDPDLATFMSVYYGHACALRRDGSPVCWGDDSHGRASPPDGRFSSISVGRDHTCALRPDGSPVCWGNDEDGQASPPDGEKLASISSGGRHTCALRSDGNPVCWGANDSGQASPPNQRFKSISSGESHTCALSADGAAVCWGSNSWGKASPPVGDQFMSISSGVIHTCALRTTGSAVCWGSDEEGLSSPPDGEQFSSISSGGTYTCALRASGSAVCWGFELTTENASPGPNERFAFISSGVLSSCAIRPDGSPVCWGAQASPPEGERFAVDGIRGG